MKVGGTNAKLLVLANTDSGSDPIVINFTIFTQDQFVGNELVILPSPITTIGGDVDTTNEKIRLIVLSAKGLKNDSDDASSHDLSTKWHYQNVS